MMLDVQPQSVDVAPLMAYLRERLGLRLDGNRGAQLRSTLVHLVVRSGAGSSAAYLDVVRTDPAAQADLLAAATVPETHFFRHPQQLSVLADRIFPDLGRSRPGGAPLRLWSAGCATGEEAYTLAMMTEAAGITTSMILATDVSPRALQKASAAVYREWSLRGEHRYAHQFEREGDRYRVPRRFTARVEVRALSLLHNPYPEQVDLILCRNVMMYLTPAMTQLVARRLGHALAEGGWLSPSPADPQLDFDGLLEPVATAGGVMYRRLGGRHLTAGSPIEHSAAGRTAFHPPQPVTDQTPHTVAARPTSQTPSQALEAMEAGDHHGALAAARGAVATGEGSAPVYAVWARALGNLGRTEEAEKVAAQAASVFLLDAELRYLHAELLLENGDPDAAAKQASAAVYLNPDLVTAHLLLGRAEMARARLEPARRSFRVAARLLASVPAGAQPPLDLGAYAALYERIAETRDPHP
jgi:chemotaxis protein methyltransferase CheR